MLNTEEKVRDFIHHIKSKCSSKRKKIEHLDLSYRGIAQLPEDAFDDLPDLKYLNLSMNQLTCLPSLEKLTRLERLKLQINQLTTLPSLHNNEKLKYLNIYGNQITHLPAMENLIHLERIFLEGNPLTFIPLSLLTRRDIVVNIEEIEKRLELQNILFQQEHRKAFKYVLGEIDCFPPEPSNYQHLACFSSSTCLGREGGQDYQSGLEMFEEMKELYG